MTWTDVTKSSPCPACGKDHWCARGDNGAIRCMCTAKAPAGYRFHKTCRDGGTVFFEDNGCVRPSNSIARRKTSPPPIDRAVEAAGYAQTLTPELAAELAGELGVPVDVLDQIGVGWCDTRSAWTFPERDAKGRVIGIVFRDRDGNKLAGRGHKRGLSIPGSLADRPDPVLLVEGPTDVLAVSAMGLAVVGRPSNRAGGELLAELLRDRAVLVVGENDEKPNGDWPGRDGAQAIARDLARRWNRPVSWTLPPAGFKDIRHWYLDDESGADLLAVLQANAQVEEPGALVTKLSRDDADRKLRGIFDLGRRFVQTHVELCLELADFMAAGGREAMGDQDGPLPLAYMAAGLGITRERVRQLTTAGQTWRRVNIVDTQDFGQLTEGHLRPLSKVEPARQVEALEAACRIARDDHEIEQGRRRDEGRQPTRLRLKATHVRRAVQAILPPADLDPDTMSSAAAALCVNETGKGESAHEVARLVSETWETVAAMPGAPRALIEALARARDLARNWEHG